MHRRVNSPGSPSRAPAETARSRQCAKHDRRAVARNLDHVLGRVRFRGGEEGNDHLIEHPAFRVGEFGQTGRPGDAIPAFRESGGRPRRCRGSQDRKAALHPAPRARAEWKRQRSCRLFSRPVRRPKAPVSAARAALWEAEGRSVDRGRPARTPAMPAFRPDRSPLSGLRPCRCSRCARQARCATPDE